MLILFHTQHQSRRPPETEQDFEKTIFMAGEPVFGFHVGR